MLLDQVVNFSRIKRYFNKTPDLVFVGGCPRSGTTLVKRILNAHSDIYCGPELGHLPQICKIFRRMQEGVRIGRIDEYANKDELKKYFREFILHFITPVAKRNGVSTFAEKTPDNLEAFVSLHALFPEANFIHVIRNPLDVVASYLRVGKRSAKPYDCNSQFFSAQKAATLWLEKVFFLKKFGKAFSDINFQSRYLVVRYEDLVRNPEMETRRICKHIGVVFESAMIDLASHRIQGDPKGFGDVFYTEGEYLRGIETSSIDRWKKDLTASQVQEVLDVTSQHMLGFGYDLP